MENRNDYCHMQANLAYSSPTPDNGPHPGIVGYQADSMEMNLAYGSLTTYGESVDGSPAELMETNVAYGSAMASRHTKTTTSDSLAKCESKSKPKQRYRLSTYCLVSVAVFNVIVSTCALILATSSLVLALIPQNYNTETVSLGSSEKAAIHLQLQNIKAQIDSYNKQIESIQLKANISSSQLIAFQSKEIVLQSNQSVCPGSDSNLSASSCQQILDCDSSSSSDYYWIAPEDGNAIQRYCSMNRVCGGRDGGWMRVAELDMRNSSNQCPSGLRERVHPGHRLCGLDIDDGGCSTVLFEMHNIKYEQVCGKIIAYQFGSTDSFGMNVGTGPTEGIDSMYVDGVSLTYSSNPRKHIWTFAAALDEVGSHPQENCPCVNINIAASATHPPQFIGNDYFCDTASRNQFRNNFLFTDDPLWDGAGCGPANFCCSLNNPPWFFKQLESSTSEDIEMRVCGNEDILNEDVRIEQFEFYVR